MYSSSPLPFAPPQSTKAEDAVRSTFQTLMWAFSNPGRTFTLPGTTFSTRQSCQQIGETLLDLETSFYTDDLLLRTALESTGAHFRTPSSAAYLFFPNRDAFESALLRPTLDCIGQAKNGTLTDPDKAATIIVSCLLGEGRKFELQGPGIQDRIALVVDELPLEFWQLRKDKINYPLGIDIFLVDGDQVVGLPRTTILGIR